MEIDTNATLKKVELMQLDTFVSLKLELSLYLGDADFFVKRAIIW